MTRAGAIALWLLASCTGSDPGDSNTTADAGAASTSLAGAVHAPDGSAVADAVVFSDPRGFETRTDAAGSYALTGLPPGSYTAIAVAPGFAATASEPALLEAGGSELRDVVLQPEVPAADPGLMIAVEGPEGPLEGATVSGGGVVAITDASGLAVLEGLPPGPVDLDVSHPRTWSRTLTGLDPAVWGGSASVALSGRPLPGAVEVGSELCALCHADPAAAHANTPHAHAAALSAAEPDVAFAQGWGVDLGSGASAQLQDGPGGPEVAITASDASIRVLPVDGWIGDPRRASVPWTELAGVAQPLPVIWVADDPDRAILAEAQARAVSFEPERWIDGAGLPIAPADPEGAEAACLSCHVTGFSAAVAVDGSTQLSATWNYGVDPRFAATGVGCERCHGPGSTHITASIADKPWTITRPDRLDADRADEVCAQCHAAVDSVDAPVPWPWSSAEGRFQPGAVLADHATRSPVLWANGHASAPAEQADEQEASPHGPGAPYGLRCFDCHDPHGDGPADAPSLRRSNDDNSLCLSCHLGPSFAGDPAAAQAHNGHLVYGPTLEPGTGRCTGCHMPRTASWSDFGAQTGAGRIASHAFTAPPPADTLAAFDAAGVSVLPPGSFPPYGCIDCHAVASAVAADAGQLFPGPYGDPAQRSTHATLETWFEAFFP